jgi:hypothetical protein
MELKSKNIVDLPRSCNAEAPICDSDSNTVEYPSAFWAACASVGVALGLFLVLTVTLTVTSKC